MKNRNGFTLIESLIAIAIFAVIGTAIYYSYSNILDVVLRARLRYSMIAVAENEIEIARNIPYPDVGLQSGAPSGNIIPQKVLNYKGASFVVKTTVRNVDDSFDGVLGGNPADVIPADYKLIEVEVSCFNICSVNPIILTTTIAPVNIEKQTKKGSLFITVFNASGEPLNGANVSIVNNSVVPPININDTTNVSGSLNFVEIATSSAGYRITATKNGYSQERTYPAGDPSNPNPVDPDPVIQEEETSRVSFAIDQVSSLTLKTQDQMCQAVPAIDFQQTSEKLIGTNPDIPKYSVSGQTDANGQKTVNNLEWDTYTFNNLNSVYEVSGVTPPGPFTVLPATNSTLTWTMEKKLSKSMLVNVIDEDEVPVNDAIVRLTGPGGYDKTRYSGRRFLNQTDWSAGQYNSKTANLETDNIPGEINVKFINGKYATSSEELISSTFDFGASDAVFYNLSWDPTSQPPQTGAGSFKLQIAANDDNSTWNFVGPNGNSNTFYTTNGTQIHASHNGKKYLRYKIFMHTDNDQFTPRLADLSMEFASSCVPVGQVFFSGLSAGTHTLNVTKNGFDPYLDDEVIVDQDWQEYEADMFVP